MDISNIYMLKDIRHGYKNNFVLDVPELAIERGSAVGFTGPNGSGKSTLLKVLALLEAPLEGSVLYEGKNTDHYDEIKDVTILLQDPYLLRRSVYGNVAYGLKMRGISDVREKVFEALRRVGLSPEVFARRAWRELSGGEAQRVALASRLVLNPRVLILDEPTSNIDQKSAELIKEAVIDIRNRHNTTLIVSSHDHVWLNRIADKIYMMRGGRIAGYGIENVIEGPWTRDRDDLWSKTLPRGEKIFATRPPEEDSAALLDPSDIILSIERPALMSAQNCLQGIISSLSSTKNIGSIKVDVDICGISLKCNLTMHAVNELNLLPGKPVWAVFKASSLQWQ